MSYSRIFARRTSHTPITPLSSLYKSPLRRLTLTHKIVFIRAYTLSTTTTTKPPTTEALRAQRQASYNLYPPPDKNKKYGMYFPFLHFFAAHLTEEYYYSSLTSQVYPRLTNTQPLAFPERLIIYHAGTGRIMYLAILKLTTIFLSALFCGVIVPAYISSDKAWWQTAGRKFPSLSQLKTTLVLPLDTHNHQPIRLTRSFFPKQKVAISGVIPLLFVAYTTAPFVSHISIHLPPLSPPLPSFPPALCVLLALADPPRVHDPEPHC